MQPHLPLTLLFRFFQDTTGGRMKDRPAAPSPEQISTITPPTFSELPQLFVHCCITGEFQRVTPVTWGSAAP